MNSPLVSLVTIASSKTESIHGSRFGLIFSWANPLIHRAMVVFFRESWSHCGRGCMSLKGKGLARGRAPLPVALGSCFGRHVRGVASVGIAARSSCALGLRELCAGPRRLTLTLGLIFRPDC